MRPPRVWVGILVNVRCSICVSFKFRLELRLKLRRRRGPCFSLSFGLSVSVSVFISVSAPVSVTVSFVILVALSSSVSVSVSVSALHFSQEIFDVGVWGLYVLAIPIPQSAWAEPWGQQAMPMSLMDVGCMCVLAILRILATVPRSFWTSQAAALFRVDGLGRSAASSACQSCGSWT
eukprot:8004492-Alexandrium_andersonii.AAC.1